MITKSAVTELPFHPKSKDTSHPLGTNLRQDSEIEEDRFSSLPRYVPTRAFDAPLEFNGKEIWKSLLSPVQNQGRCGACWAIASTSALADTFNIHSEGRLNIELSAARLILCNIQDAGRIDRGADRGTNTGYEEVHVDDISNLWSKMEEEIITDACFGDSLAEAWSYLYIYGTVLNSCFPFEQNIGNHQYNLATSISVMNVPMCIYLTGALGDMCTDSMYDPMTGQNKGTPAIFYRAWAIFSIEGMEDMMQSIYESWSYQFKFYYIPGLLYI